MIAYLLLLSVANCLLVAVVLPELPLVVLPWLVPLLSCFVVIRFGLLSGCWLCFIFTLVV